MTFQINTLLKNTKYKLSQFSDKHIARLVTRIFDKEIRGKATPYVTCIVRDKAVKLTPEEAIRQLYLLILTEDLNYPIKRLSVEYKVTMGSGYKRADICVLDKDDHTTPYIICRGQKTAV